MDISMTLAEWRVARKLTLRQLGEKVGVSAMSMSRIEKGAQRPSPQLANQIEALTKGQVSAASLVGLTSSTGRRRGVGEDAPDFKAGGYVTISIAVSAETADILKKARVDIEKTARKGAEQAIKDAQAQAWRAANAGAIEASKHWVEKHGTLAQQLGLI